MHLSMTVYLHRFKFVVLYLACAPIVCVANSDKDHSFTVDFQARVDVFLRRSQLDTAVLVRTSKSAEYPRGQSNPDGAPPASKP